MDSSKPHIPHRTNRIPTSLLSDRNIQTFTPKHKHPARTGCLCGGPEGSRTPDLRNANATLYQLSYRPLLHFFQIVSRETISVSHEVCLNVSRETFISTLSSSPNNSSSQYLMKSGTIFQTLEPNSFVAIHSGVIRFANSGNSEL